MASHHANVFPDDVVGLASDSAVTGDRVVGRVCCLGTEDDADVHVYWLRRENNDLIEQLAAVEVVDRALLHGDLVRETTGAERAGLVRHAVDLQGPELGLAGEDLEKVSGRYSIAGSASGGGLARGAAEARLSLRSVCFTENRLPRHQCKREKSGSISSGTAA